MRAIPATMATQHPDNAQGPYWDTDDGFVAVHEEPEECVSSFRDLGVQEFMWDWEGKYADESVIEKLLSQHFEYFKKNPLGKKKFLTFRLPNVWQEKGYSLIRALMVILTSEDLAEDVRFKDRPLFEAILPMTERAEQLLYIQRAFQKLARFKSKVFSHRKNHNTEYVEIIPLVEGVEHQTKVGELLAKYLRLHKRIFRKKPLYVRPFLARSDPALVSGLTANVLANKIALSDIYDFGQRYDVAVYPIIGAGGLVFRGGLTPARAKKFAAEYAGVRTVTIQSAFRYDNPLTEVKKALRYLERHLQRRAAVRIPRSERAALLKVMRIFSKMYQSTLPRLIKDVSPIFAAVPRRRERRQHIGLLSYGRRVGKKSLPRAISFTAAFYSVGVPPEFLGTGRALLALTDKERDLLKKYYRYFTDDLIEAGKYLNRENLEGLARGNPAWKAVAEDIALTEKYLGVRFGPRADRELLHRNLTSQLLLQRKSQKDVSRLIVETGKLRKSLG
ncbi:MAG: phosphoenolpyruvate carboxylase [Candidatus Kaiserbacteria bacterium]|nr:MAG: phosphoenolpyruvate carboxylase [Candidatus Kaiserbacteria bacterium]